MKRGINGTYVGVEPFHLFRYLDEQVFRFENRATKDRPLKDFDRFKLAASQIVGKRLTWDEVTGKSAVLASALTEKERKRQKRGKREAKR